jgi:glycosyltransferase involved in cell wall biosynthesis
MADKFFVTAVIVTHDGETWLPKVIAALGSQKRQVDRIIAVDTGSKDNSRKLLKSARIPFFEEDREMGYGDAIDHALELTPIVDEDEWIWLIHDDCAPDKNALAQLLKAVEDRPQVAIAGPKLRGWYDTDHLLEVGVSIASNGSRWTGLERREQDQGQHDEIREVLAVSTAGALIRRSVYEELGGLDTNLALFRDDVDLGWRAYVAGHSVIVVPQALAYHAEASSTERRAVDVSEAFLHRPLLLDRRNAAYVLLVNSSWWTLPWIAIQLFTTSVARAVMNLLAKLPGYAGDEIAAVGLVLINPREIFQARRYRKKKRLISPRIIRRFIPPRWSQFRMASEGIASLVSEAIRPAKQEPDLATTQSYSDIGVIGENFDDPELPVIKDVPFWKLLARKPHFIMFAMMSMISLLAARLRLGTLSGGALAVAPQSGLDLLGQYAQSWHLVGLGSAAVTPPWVPILGLASFVTGFNLPLFITLLFLLAPILAFYIFFRVLTKLGSSRYYALVGAGIYAFSPVLWASINQGRIGTLIIILMAPSLFFIAPFTRDNERATWRRIFAISLLIAVFCAFNPIVLAGWLVLQGYRLGVNIFELRHHYREMGFQKLIFAPQSDALKRRFTLFITPWILMTPWSLAMVLHPTQFFLEPGIPVQSGIRWPQFLANPGGPGTPPLWLISPVVLFALTAFTIKNLRTSSFMATSAIAAGLALSTFSIQGHGSFANIWAGPLIAIATALVVPGVLLYAESFIPTLRVIPLGKKHFLTGLIALITGVALVGTPIWAITGGSQSLVRANQEQIVPAFVTALADTPAKPKTVVINVIDGQTMYGISRGTDIQLGDADVTIAPPQEIVQTMSDLISGSGITSSKILGQFGIQYVFLKSISNESLIRIIDGSGGFTRVSSTPNGIVWKVVGASPRVLFVGRDKSTSVVPSSDISAQADISQPGIVLIAEKYDQNWRLLLDGQRIPLQRSSNGLPVFTIPHSGHIIVLYDATLHRGLLSLQLIALLAVIVLALPAGRRKREIALEELV